MLRHLPNALCVLRMLLAIPLAWLLVRGQYAATLLLFGFAAATDALDGYLAKRNGWTSELGKALDPLADKILLITAFVALTSLHAAPLWLAAPVVLRDVIIAAGAIVYRYLFGPLTDAHPTVISKINTLVQIIFVLSVVAGLALGARWTIWTGVLITAVLITTVASGIDYVATYIRLALQKSRERRAT